VNDSNFKQILLEEIGKIAPEMEGVAVDPDANLREAFDLDSMDFLNLVAAIHKRLGIDVPEAEYARLSSLNAAVTYLVKRAGTA
jgi:acyl carrier protein